MTKSTFTFEEGEAIDVGQHGEHSFVFEEGTPVSDKGESNFVFEEGTGLRGLGALIDDFEDGDLSEYTELVEGSGTTQIVTSPVQAGTYAVEIVSTNATRLYSLSGLNAYPAPGDTWEFYTYFDSQGDVGGYFDFGVQNANSDGYRFRFDTREDSQDDISLQDVAGGTFDSASVTFSTGTWVRGEISWGAGGAISAELAGATLSANSTKYGSGGIGLDANVDVGAGITRSVFFDSITKI